MMTPPPVLLAEHTLLLISVLLLLGGGFIGAILWACHRAEAQIPAGDQRAWKYLLITAVLLVALTRPGTDYVSPADRITLRPAPPAPTLRQALAACPPHTEGMTAQIVFTIESRADADPVVTGCTRIAEQQYITQSTKGR